MECKSGTGYWQDLSNSDKANQMFTTGYLADCKFIVGPDNETAEIMHGHKLMFIMASPVLEKMLDGQFVEAEEKSEIRIIDAYPHDFKNFRYLIYNNHLSTLSELPLEDVIEVHRLCHKYMVSSISTNCIKYVTNLLPNSSMSTLVTIFEFACGLEDKSLLIAVKKAITSRQVKIDDKINDLSGQVFYEYIQFLFQLNELITAKTLFSAINSYCLHNNLFTVEDDQKEVVKPQKKDEKEKLDDKKKLDEKEKMDEKKKLDKEKLVEKDDPATKVMTKVDKYITFRIKLLKLINFNQMSTQDFINGPGKSRLLCAEQKYDFLSKLCQQITINNNDYF